MHPAYAASLRGLIVRLRPIRGLSKVTLILGCQREISMPPILLINRKRMLEDEQHVFQYINRYRREYFRRVSMLIGV